MAKKNTDVDTHTHQYDDHGMCSCGSFQDRGLITTEEVTAPVDLTDTDIEPSHINLDNYSGTYRGKDIADLDQVVDQIATGRTIDPGNDNVFTFSFYNAAHGNGWFNSPGIPKFGGGTLNGGEGMSPFGANQEAAARLAVMMWDDLIPQSFVEVNGHGGGVADIVFANSYDPAQAFAYYPGNYRGYWDSFTSDVFIADPDINWTNAWFMTGGYGNTTLIHELGHTVGLSHPGAYNGAGATNYANQAEYAQDSEQYSIMSYWDAAETNPIGQRMLDHGTFFYHNPQTPLLHDILAVQAQYGADPTTRVGDTTYGFNITADINLWVYDFNENPYPYMAVYDAGGNDTIDLSGFTSAGQYLDLNDGQFSSIGDGPANAADINAARIEMLEFYPGSLNTAVTQATADSITGSWMANNEFVIAFYTGIDGIFASNYDNFAIAYGTMIENGIGGQQRDAIIGNELDNFLDGQAGDDVIFGNAGDDTIVGGLGDDEISGGAGADEMSGNAGADTFVLDDLDLGDVITDFDGAGEGDMIDLTYFANGLGTDLTFIADAAFSGASGEVRYENGVLEVSFGGDTTGDYSVTLANNADVDATMLALTMSA